jgi:hypothetical protein
VALVQLPSARLVLDVEGDKAAKAEGLLTVGGLYLAQFPDQDSNLEQTG